jgi:cob(I)alamin adenosyltransferase
MQPLLSRIQHELFDLGGELCIPNFILIKEESITRLEHAIDELLTKLTTTKRLYFTRRGQSS